RQGAIWPVSDLSLRSVLQLSTGAGQAPECGTLTSKLSRSTRRQYFLLAGVEPRLGGRRSPSTLLGPEGSVAYATDLPADRRPARMRRPAATRILRTSQWTRASL